MSDKIQYVNGLLAATGVSERALDATTANNLLDKYSNQIVARLGQGSLGTDAARSIVQSAYPNAKMTPDAIKEAVSNLQGANEMVKAKTALLAPHAASRDPVAYSQKEITFDQNADPRIWQWMSIRDPNQKKAFAAQVMQQDPNFPKKIQALEQLGVFNGSR
jgi:Lhr-like helicase